MDIIKSRKVSYKYALYLLILVLGYIQPCLAEDTETKIFDPNVRSLFIENPDNFFSPPVIRLGTSDRLSVSFDILGDAAEYLRFNIIHCNADWQPSRLLESEYLDGFNEVEVNDFAYSNNTFIHYVNYKIEIPNPDLPIIHSGNYLLKVYPEYMPENPLLQIRFSVSENILPIGGAVSSNTDKGFNTEFQQLKLFLNLPENSKINPYQDLTVSVIQNNTPSTQKNVYHPSRIDGRTAIYEHEPNLIFPASNEFRRFETVRIDYPGMHVDSVRFENPVWNAFLKEDLLRKDREYVYDMTQHGKFKIDEYNSTDPDLGADYVMTHFTLDIPQIFGANVFIDGDFTLHQYNENTMLKYDFNTNKYYLDLPLKQGSYNYRYVVKEEGKDKPDLGFIEGNKYETSNEYLVQVFLRSPGSRGDRLIGSTILTTGF